MRTDTTAGNKNLATIFDVDAQKMYVLDVEDKKAKVWDMAAFASQLSATVSPEGMQASMKANGQTKAISGQKHGRLRHRHRRADDRRRHADDHAPQRHHLDRGSAPGGADYSAFYQGAADKGWIFSDPRAAQDRPGRRRPWRRCTPNSRRPAASL